MKFLHLFSIKQKIAILLVLLLSSVSYLAISYIQHTQQRNTNLIQIDIVEQQKLILANYLSQFLLTNQQANISENEVDRSELKQSLFVFSKNAKSLLIGGKAYPDLTMQDSVYVAPITDLEIRKAIKSSQNQWLELQQALQTLHPTRATLAQLSIVQHVSDNLHDTLSNIATNLSNANTQQAAKELLILQISWLAIAILGVFFSWLIAKNISQPLNNAAKITSRIRLGDLQHYPDQDNRRDELGTFIYEVDEMRRSLGEVISNIEQQNKQVIHSSAHLSDLLSEIIKTQQETTEHLFKLLKELKLEKNINLEEHHTQQELEFDRLHKSIDIALLQLKETENKITTSQLFTQDLYKTSVQIEQLTSGFKIDKKDKRARRGNDKRIYPRIHNQLEVSLQQGNNVLHGLTQDISLTGLQMKSLQAMHFDHNKAVSFVINLPKQSSEQGDIAISFVADIVHYQEQQTFFLYRLHFHPLPPNEQAKIQTIFDYFDKKSEFKVPSDTTFSAD